MTTTTNAWTGTEHTWHAPSVLHELPKDTVVLLEGDDLPYRVDPLMRRINEAGDDAPGYWNFSDVESRVAVLHVPPQPLTPGQFVDLALLRRLPTNSIVIDHANVAYQLMNFNAAGTVQRWYSAGNGEEDDGHSHESLFETHSMLRLAWVPA